jgi:pimeloyl-ACP methyl ester carboxylesterase
MKKKEVSFKDIGVHYTDSGEGPCIIFLHGYLESEEIWKDFISLLDNLFRVICIDLPGHGRSGIWGRDHGMDDLAGSVIAVADAEGIDKMVLVGHSMGGYVTMAFADLFPERLLGYSLFHSTCFADTDEKKTNREREISLILCKKKRQIVSVNIPKAFSDDNATSRCDEVTLAKKIAMQNPDNGIIAILNGMKERPDRTEVLTHPGIPLLLIGGMKDNYIPAEVFERLVSLAPHATAVRLEESGHMGFFEEPQKSADSITRFVEEILSSDSES